MINNDLIFLGGLNSNLWINDGKNNSRNFKQGYRVYDSFGISNTISSNSLGGFGGHSGIYLVVQKCGDRDKEGGYTVHDYSNCIPANPMSDRGQMVIEIERNTTGGIV